MERRHCFIYWLYVLILVKYCQATAVSTIRSPIQVAEVEIDLEAYFRRVQYQPRHVHISYGNDISEMFVTWSTIDSIAPLAATVEFGRESIDEARANGTSVYFKSPGAMNLTQYIHRVTLTGLIPGETYTYHCGSDLGWSEKYNFRAMPEGSDWSPQFAIFGDMGNENAKSLPRLQREVHLNMYDAIIHAGDFGYDLDTDDGLVGDSFMDQIQPIAAYVPYMACPGNHEYRDNFLHYKNRFTMPGKFDSMVYSWDIGPIHFISFSTEFYYFLQYGIKPLIKQYEYIEADLKEASKPENRAKRPWIVTYAHRPMYCSNDDHDDCTRQETLVRVGIPYVHWFGLEDLFMEYGVDLTIWAHEHSYERLWPIYNHAVYNGSIEEPYKNPRALIHVITGSGGCSEIHDPFKPEMPDWSAFRSLDYGYSRLRAINKTHLYFEQVSDDQDGKVIDSFTLIRDTHGPYPKPSDTAA